jgi:hypothetical protein
MWDENLLKFTQPVLMQSYNNEFKLPRKSYRMPAPAGLVLVAGKKKEALSPAMQKKYCSGTGKAMHVMQYSKPETYNAVQDLSCHMHKAMQDHFKAMLRVLKYSLDTVEHGLGATNARGVGRERRGKLRGGCMSKLCVQ